MRSLVIGATGYVGRRLVSRLLADGHTVRCMARDTAALAAESWYPRVDAVRGDALDPATSTAAMRDVEVVYYLVHALGEHGFAERDRRAATVTAAAAETAGVRRIVHLGGLGERAEDMSAHLASRTEVADILLAGAVPAVVLRAGLIVGSGSASFELLRHLCDASLVLPRPAWLETRMQPVAIGDVLHYLSVAAAVPGEPNRTFDIGGPVAMRYVEIVQGYLEASGSVPRVLVPAPRPAPSLAALLATLVTPVRRSLAEQLIASLGHDMVCAEQDADTMLGPPPGGRTPFPEAVRRACADAVPAPLVHDDGHRDPALSLPRDPVGAGGPLLTEERVRRGDASRQAVWSVIERIGGERGWHTLPLVWELRAGAERLLGNEAATRGRDDPERLRVGASVDWWRVHSVRPGHSVLLVSELYTPGTVWLELSVDTDPDATVYRQRIVFVPDGTAGRAYWYAQKPLHDLVFETMSRNIVRRAENRSTVGTPLLAAAALAGEATRGAIRLAARVLSPPR